MILLIFIIISIFCGYYNYKFLQKAYSKGGRWDSLNIREFDLIWVFMPIFNIVAFVDNLCNSPYQKEYKKPKNYNKFFKIKK